jgi:hypothetical protein
MKSKKARTEEQLREVLEMGLSETSLPVRTVNILEETSPPILTVEDLLNTNKETLLSIVNFGVKSITQVYDALADLGLERQIPPEEVVEKEISAVDLVGREEVMRLLLMATSLAQESCALLATGGILTVEDALGCSEETLLFLFSQEHTDIEAQKALMEIRSVLKNLGVNSDSET